MKIISISKTVQNLDYKSNIQNYETWSGMAKYFKEIYLIVVSPDAILHTEQCGNIHVTWLPFSKCLSGILPFEVRLYRCAYSLMSENNIDVIDIGEPVFSGIPAVRLKKKTKKPLVVQIQGQFLNLPAKNYGILKSWLIKRITLYVCKKANRVRTVSQEIYDSLTAANINPDKVYVIPSRCDTRIFTKEKYLSDRETTRNKLGYKDNDTVLLFAGRLIPAKDVETIINAMHRSKDRYSNIKLLIVGDGECMPALIQQTALQKLEEVICFYGRVPYSDMPKILASGDIFISPSLDEGLPRSVLEAMAMSMPVIVTPVGGNKEVIRHMENGVLVPIKDPEKILEAVIQLISDKLIFDLIAENARKTVVELYDYEDCIERFAKVHMEII